MGFADEKPNPFPLSNRVVRQTCVNTYLLAVFKLDGARIFQYRRHLMDEVCLRHIAQKAQVLAIRPVCHRQILLGGNLTNFRLPVIAEREQECCNCDCVRPLKI